MNPERTNPLLLWQHEGLDIEHLALLDPPQRSIMLWSHTKSFLRRNCSHYRRVLDEAGDPDLDRISALPFIDGPFIATSGEELLCESAASDYTHFTGGTLSSPKRLFHDMRENAYRNAALAAANGPAPKRTSIEARILDVNHGYPLPIPELSGHRVIGFPLEYEFHFEAARDLLDHYGRMNGRETITALHGPQPYVLALTSYLMEREFDFSVSMVNLILVTGWHTSKPWRRRLEEAWGARVVDVYGMTEFWQSYATQCVACSAHHFSWLTHQEVVDLEDGRPIDLGVGELVLTHFIPFALRQPLLRYRTGDLFQLGGWCGEASARQYYPGGRVRHATRVDKRPSPMKLDDFIRGTEIKDALESVDFIRHEDDPRARAGFLAYARCLMPIFTFHVVEEPFTTPTLRVCAETTLRPSSGSGQFKDAEEAVAEAILRSSPAAARLAYRDELLIHVRLLPVGTISNGATV